jgi:hypothetical protein
MVAKPDRWTTRHTPELIDPGPAWWPDWFPGDARPATRPRDRSNRRHRAYTLTPDRILPAETHEGANT